MSMIGIRKKYAKRYTKPTKSKKVNPSPTKFISRAPAPKRSYNTRRNNKAYNDVEQETYLEGEFTEAII
jgi:hypothetical protein